MSDDEQIAAWRSELDRAGRVELRTSRRRLTLILVGGLALVAASAWGALSDPTSLEGLRTPVWEVRAFGWFGLVFFGLAVVTLVRRLISGGSTVVITREHVDSTGAFRIAWADVAAVVVTQVRRTRIIALRARDAGAQRAALVPRRSRALTGPLNAFNGGPDLQLPTDLGGSRTALARWLSTLVPHG